MKEKNSGRQKGRCGWSKGFTKKTHLGLAKISKALKGRPSWKKDLTKETEVGIAAQAKKMIGRLPWSTGLTKETDPRVAKMSKALKGRPGWNTGFTKETHPSLATAAGKLTGRTKEDYPYLVVMAEKMKEKFQDPEYLKNYTEGCNRKPNKLELRFDEILQEILPGEYKYVGDFQYWLGGKNPDFANVNGQKKLIALYGDHWHQGDDPQDRIDHFKQYGFDTLIIWEHEIYGDPDAVIEKVIDFHYLEQEIIKSKLLKRKGF